MKRLYFPIADTDKRFVNTIAKRTGEFRPPKQGEYYISGAIPEAYRAPNDLTSSFYIAKLVKSNRGPKNLRRAFDF